MLKKFIARKKGERGQSFMELAISMVFLLVMLCVIIDLGWAFYTMIALRDAAQEAAAFGSMCPVEDRIVERLQLSASAPIDMDDILAEDIVVEFLDPVSGADADPVHGNLVKVTAEFDHEIIVPFAATFLGRSSYPLSVNVADTILRDQCPN